MRRPFYCRWVEDAERWGLIWKCVPDDTLMPEAEKLSAALAQGPTRTLGLIKKAIYSGTQNTLPEQLDLERDQQRSLGDSADYREGVAAFREKRAPKFTGK